MTREPLFHTDCPSCGAPVGAHSATAVTLVCPYCNSMLVREAGGVTDKGRDSALLEDYSPLQIGTQGRWGTQPFSLIGRLQMHYDAGVWNEWYVLFDDGSTGWLAEAGDIYVFTRPTPAPPRLPEFDRIRAGFTTFDFQNKRFTASDVREVTLSHAAAQGELPFELAADRTSRVADWRCENIFFTTDYSDNPPAFYLGSAVKLDDLRLQYTRTADQISQSAGRLKGSRQSENCPHCGSPVHWISGMADNILCPSCGSDLEAVGGKIELIEANAMREAQQQALTLPVGSSGTLGGKTYTVIGALHKDEYEAQTAFDLMYALKRPFAPVPVGRWREYLLYHPVNGFLWLIESSSGWETSRTLRDWPRLDRHGRPQGCEKISDYGSRVGYAAGAFYWHVRSGDFNYYSDYRSGRGKLCTELSTAEMAWSLSEPIDSREIARAFGLEHSRAQTDGESDTNPGLVWTMIAALAVLNLPALIADDGNIIITLLSAYSLYRLGGRSEEDGTSMIGSRTAYIIIGSFLILFTTAFNYLPASDSSGTSGYGGGGYGAGGFVGGHK
ncbi:NAD-dependent DNA ligase C4 zinc finger domain [Kingella potus]|uniref:NAD-dependent DNA ligase C4 zinc finger domain n=1 Tax=Kingella potus TaxID=265175 RepID=A0A377R3E5_9NEIS|nr:DUF4178 domain-containing protein [Kingella potus]STR02734.1 NAD-dependent DNA ligase C4 zinc finger domain [Kingella potus]